MTQATIQPFLVLASVGAIHLIAVISPGPAFLMVSRATLGMSRMAGVATGLGVALAATTFAAAASLGLSAVLDRLPMLARALQLCGGAYLLWLGIASWRHAGTALEPAPASGTRPPRGTVWRAVRRGYLGNLGNPKMIVFFGSIFVTLFTPGTPDWVRYAALGLIAFNEAAWYALVACALSTGFARRAYGRAKGAIERVMGAVLGGFGLRLIGGALLELR